MGTENPREADLNWLSRGVFIVGHPKSGTSLLLALLDGAGKLLVLPEETHFFRLLDEPYHRRGRMSREAFADWAVKKLLGVSRLRLMGSGQVLEDLGGESDYRDFPWEEFQGRFREQVAAGEPEPRRALDALVRSFYEVTRGAGVSEPVGWVEKTPDHYRRRRVALLAEWYSDARFIHIVRDPRDNYVSYKRKHETLTVGRFCRNWRRAVGDGRANQHRLGADRYMMLRYEDLVGDTVGMTRKICEFLGLEFSEAYLRPTKYGKPWSGNSMWGERLQTVNAAPVGRFRRWHKPAEIRLVEDWLAREMQEWGYEAAYPGGGLRRWGVALWRGMSGGVAGMGDAGARVLRWAVGVRNRLVRTERGRNAVG